MISYIAKETFHPPWGPTNEIITLDCMLCPDIMLGVLTTEDWNYIDIYAEVTAGIFFSDVDYLLSRIESETEYQVLAALRGPTLEAIQSFTDERFDFKGYDLVEVVGGNSAITNCGGFDQAFSDDDLSPWGLIPDHESAYRIRDLLREHYPDEHHADCHVWAVWRMKRQSDFFRNSPLVGVDLDLTRDRSPARDASALGLPGPACPGLKSGSVRDETHLRGLGQPNPCRWVSSRTDWGFQPRSCSDAA